jgi:predicted transcriptional regulator
MPVGRGGDEMPGNEEKVLEAMKKAGEPVKPGDLVELAGLSKDEITKTINALKKDGRVTSPKRCFYSPAG